MQSISSLLKSCFCALSMLGAMTSAQDKPAQTPPPPPPAPLVSPEVHSDGSATFRFCAPNAVDVRLAREGAEPVSMQKSDQGVWTATTTPLAPDYYGYSLVADGVRLIDPENPLLTPNLLATGNAVHVPGRRRCRES
jgi:hypothetical protein